MVAKLKPLQTRVLVIPAESEKKTDAGILIPEIAQRQSQEGKALAVGKDVQEVKEGDEIIFSKYGTTEVKMEQEELLMVKEEDILAIVEE